MSLSLNNICIGNVFIKLKHCDSTNVFAKELLSKSEPIEGAVIFTDFQSKGKGQIGNTWHSEDGKNLTFSVILKPTFLDIRQQFVLSQIASLACMDTLEYYVNKKFLVKWPNDIYFENKKIGGILIENIISNSKMGYSILGVGLNINQEYFPMLPKAISLKNIMYHNYDLNKILSFFLKRLDVYYLKVREGNLADINTKYLKNLLGLNQKLIFNERGILFSAIVKGISSRGLLILELENGLKKEYNFKEISWHLV